MRELESMIVSRNMVKTNHNPSRLKFKSYVDCKHQCVIPVSSIWRYKIAIKIYYYWVQAPSAVNFNLLETFEIECFRKFWANTVVVI